MSSTNVQIMMDIIIIVFGFYMIYAAVKMKDTNVPPTLMVSIDEIKGAKDVPGFCKAIFKHMLVLSGGCLLYGITGLIYNIYIRAKLVAMAEAGADVLIYQIFFVASVAIFIGIVGYFVIIMRKLKAKFL